MSTRQYTKDASIPSAVDSPPISPEDLTSSLAGLSWEESVRRYLKWQDVQQTWESFRWSNAFRAGIVMEVLNSETGKIRCFIVGHVNEMGGMSSAPGGILCLNPDDIVLRVMEIWPADPLV